MPDFTSPDVRNYAIFKGNVYFKKSGDATRRHLGNCTGFNFEPAVDTLDHFSAMQGVRKKDFSAVVGQTATITITLEEMTLKNLQLALFGGEIAADGDTTDGGANLGFEIFAASEVSGILELEGSNDIGPKYNIRLPSVTFKPNGGIEFIGDQDWANTELQGEVLAVGESFGRIWLQDSAVTTT